MVLAGSGTKVVKSSGDSEVFDPNIITSDCVEAGVEFWTAAEVALEVSKEVFDGINSNEIQGKILTALYNRNPEVAERYKRFHSMFVRTSNNTIERFDRKRIANSLVKETHLPKELAEVVARETETELRRLNLDFTSGPLIREIVNVKLLEHGYESARSDYTRLGMPVYDASQLIETGPRDGRENPEASHREMANSIFREYSLLKVLPLHLADAHMKGDFHIHNLEHFAIRPHSAIHDLRFFLTKGLQLGEGLKSVPNSGPAKDATVAALHAVKAMIALGTNFSSRQGLHHFNIWLAPYLEGFGASQIRQLAQTVLFEIAQTHPLINPGGNGVDLEIEYAVPEKIAGIPAVLPGGITQDGLVYRDYEDLAREFAIALIEVYREGDFRGLPLNAVHPIIKIRKEATKRDDFNDFLGLVHNTASKNRPISILNTTSTYLDDMATSLSSGLIFQQDKNTVNALDNGELKNFALQQISLNLPRVAYRSGEREDTFFEALGETMELIGDVASIKRDKISKRLKSGALPFLANSEGEMYFELDNAVNVVSYVGVNEAVKAFIGDELHESAYSQEFATSIIKHLSDELARISDNSGMRFILSSISLPEISKRFSILDSGQFSEASISKTPENEIYTYSQHVSDKANISLKEKQKIEDAFTKFASGGLTIKPGEALPEVLMDISKTLLKENSAYWSFAP